MLNLARVVAVHPESHSVDLVMMDDGRRLPGAQVLAPMAGGNVGLADLPQPDVSTPRDRYATRPTGQRDIIAVVAFSGSHPLVLGFLFPQVAQCLFADVDRMVYRHASDLYYTIDGAGNAELAHPSGAYVRIGTSPAHEDLTGRDYDKKWAIVRNVDQAPHIHVSSPGGLGSVDISPDGDVVIACGAFTLTAGSVTINGPTNINGAALTHNSTNVGATHGHMNVQPGSGTSGPPTGGTSGPADSTLAAEVEAAWDNA